MNHEEVRDLEQIVQDALSKALRSTSYASVPPQILHLMAKAAVTVLEATLSADKPPRPRR